MKANQTTKGGENKKGNVIESRNEIQKQGDKMAMIRIVESGKNRYELLAVVVRAQYRVVIVKGVHKDIQTDAAGILASVVDFKAIIQGVDCYAFETVTLIVGATITPKGAKA